MEIVTGDRYLEKLVKFVEEHAESLLEGTQVLKLNPAGLWYVQSRLEALRELERMLAGAPVDYLRAYVSDLGDHRAVEQLRRILRLLTSLKVVSSLPPPIRDPTPLALLPFGRLRVLELRGCDLSTSAAKGLLELRHTLEKIICHNSTDALRHVFASRIVEIKDSPHWNRLSFVSCACNRLVLMDESLQLLPAVETLDLSRNKFAKVDSLRKCTKLKHLDLGFNNLRTISYFSEVSSHIVKLVLRNNALTTLRGIENLKSLEGLDLSYNIISNFSELEFLVDFESFYILQKKVSRLAAIVSDEESTYVCSDQESASCDNEIQSKDENVKSDDEAEIADLIKQVERLKKERSVLWLREFKDWMDHSSENCVDVSNDHLATHTEYENFMKNKKRQEHHGESSRNMLGSIQASGDERSTNILKPDNPFADTATGFHSHQNTDNNDLVGATGGILLPGVWRMDPRDEHQPPYLPEGNSNLFMQAKNLHPDTFTTEDQRIVENDIIPQLTATDDITESRSSSVYPGSPPHYREDVLHRRHNLVEEILQLSAESFSVASSDSNTSCCEDESCESEQLCLEGRQSLDQECTTMCTEQLSSSVFHVDNSLELGDEIPLCREVALILSSENKFYVLLLGVALDGSGAILSLLGWHKVEDIRDILVGLGLQVLRMYIEGDGTYLLITRSIEKSTQLLHTLQSFESHAADKFALRSLEQVQVELFGKQICEGLRQSLFQYSMVIFCCSYGEGMP
ncbi:uncharacterized protein LOC110823372, partial [Carica papaya]|uniref:uncharacterized protein LOC110823372 n=1 Tax=Carica papaya TaxID=3649 RepID=UPI000B8CD228